VIVEKCRSVVQTVAFVLVVAVLLLPLTACDGGSSTEGMTTYTSDDYGYSFAYPAGWKLEEGRSEADVSAGSSATASVSVYDPQGAVAEEMFIDIMQVSVYELTVTVDDSNMDEIKSEVETVLASLESQGDDLETLAPLDEAKVAGMDGYSVTYSFTKSGSPVTSTLYFLFSGDLEYQVTVQASDENWEANQSVFESMLDSFEPTPQG